MQTAHDAGANRPRTTSPPSAQGLLPHTDLLSWERTDWARPVGSFAHIVAMRKTSTVGNVSFSWVLTKISHLWLGHLAAMHLLQGMPLNELLIPNHVLRGSHMPPELDHPAQAGHLVLRVDPWQCWRPRPVLTGLVLAVLPDEIAGLSTEEVLGALATDSRA